MKKLIELNYQSTVQRGLITPSTDIADFLNKLDEEVDELNGAYEETWDDLKEELSDVILVCLNFARHYGIDIEQELLKKIEKNFKRAETSSS
jgi:NTP pyrophosphatase (non-canonical NTP hydrolase)